MAEQTKEEKILLNLLDKLAKRFIFGDQVEYSVDIYGNQKQKYFNLDYYIDLEKLLDSWNNNEYALTIYNIPEKIEKVIKHLGLPEDSIHSTHNVGNTHRLSQEQYSLKTDIEDFLKETYQLTEDEINDIRLWVEVYFGEDDFYMQPEIGSAGQLTKNYENVDLRKLVDYIESELIPKYPLLNSIVDESSEINYWWEY